MYASTFSAEEKDFRETTVGIIEKGGAAFAKSEVSKATTQVVAVMAQAQTISVQTDSEDGILQSQSGRFWTL